jgi:hypothetical protein
VKEYSSWSSETPDVVSVLLDAQNPRIPELGHQATQREIVAELVHNDAVYDLARDIATLGYFPTETLICVEEDENLVVVEGNRRLASLKLLLSPELAPSEFVSRFKKLSKDLPPSGVVKKVSVLVAPSRSQAAPLIMNKHTQTGIRRWEPIQQARYVSTLLSTGLSLDQLAETTGFSKGELLKNLRIHSMYEIAIQLSFDSKTTEGVKNPRKFNVSTLERVVDNPRMRKFMGIAFDQAGGVIGSVHPDDFKKVYKKIVHDIVSGEIDTRKLNNATAVHKYIADLGHLKPKRGGSFTSATLLGGRRDAGSEAPPSLKAKSRTGRASPYLIPRTLKCELSMPRLSDILWELQRLRVDGFENGVSVLLRIFVEMSISHYMESTGSMKQLVARLDKDGKKPPSWTPSFRQMLGYLLQNDKALIAAVPKQAVKALNKAVSDDEHPLSLDSMDQFVHNPYDAPTERRLRQFWNSFEKLVLFLMEDHSTDPTVKVTK